MRKRSPLGILPRHSYRDAIGEQRRKGERLGMSPIDCVLERVAAPRKRPLNRWVQSERRWPGQQLFVQRNEPFRPNRCVGRRRRWCHGSPALALAGGNRILFHLLVPPQRQSGGAVAPPPPPPNTTVRSEEHTSELQFPSHLLSPL